MLTIPRCYSGLTDTTIKPPIHHTTIVLKLVGGFNISKGQFSAGLTKQVHCICLLKECVSSLSLAFSDPGRRFSSDMLSTLHMTHGTAMLSPRSGSEGYM